jgi:acetylglutamate kinase
MRKDPATGQGAEVDLGFVGEPAHVDVRIIHALTGGGLVPVIAPVGVDENGQTYNINADTVAAAVAGALNATRLLMLTDVPGVLDKDKNLIDELTLGDVERLVGDGTITGGMIPKVENCVEAVKWGVKAAVILDGRVQHACLLELFTESGRGTLIRH